MEAIVRARSLSGFAPCVLANGGDPAAILRRAGLSQSALKDEENWISLRRSLRAYELAAQALNDPGFGVKLAQFQGAAIIGPPLLIARHSESLLAALDNLARYSAIQNTGYRSSLTISGDVVQRAIHLEPSLRHQADQWMEESLLFGIRLISEILGERLEVLRVRLRHRALRSVEQYEQDYGAPVAFEQPFDGIEFHRHYLDLPVPNRDAMIHRFMIEYLEKRVPQGADDIIVATRVLLETLLPAAHGRLEVVAEQLGLEPRTYQRRLQKLGYSFSTLLDSQRRLMAERLLQEGRLPLTNIAYELGYAEHSAFIHAFTRWHGMAPSRWARNVRT
ncbi:AraC family transcriptional regulator [Phenylobacterium sp.]|uniref:AraC family transcriptional regulator n=1 Tax=Phenylobacterium sp. TaxID=1871053 RepID=UPI0035B2D0AF